ncbi:hypothetical protein Peur_065563 [Populus x canadensis]
MGSVLLQRKKGFLKRHFCRGGLSLTYPTANGCLDHGEELVNNTKILRKSHEICITASLSANEWHSKSTISFYPTQVKNMNSQAKRNLKSYSAVLPARQLTISLDGSSITSSIPSGKKPSGLITTLLYSFLIRTHLVPQLCQQNSTWSETTLSNYDRIDS